MRLKPWFIGLGCALSINTFSGQMGAIPSIYPEPVFHPWSVIGSLGYTWFNGAYEGGPTASRWAQHAIGDGQTALGRLALARDLAIFEAVYLGAEIGVQNGDSMRLDIPQTSLRLVGGSPVQVTIKPMLDLLASATWQPVDSIPLFGIVKTGIAYRRLQVNDRVTFNDLSQVGFEIQAGLGMHLFDRVNLSMSYQGITNGHSTYTISTVDHTGHISNIQSQNGLLLSLAYVI